MKLKDLIDVLGSGCEIRIGTELGNGWLFANKTIHFDEFEWHADFMGREVVSVFDVEKRSGSKYGMPLNSGFGIIVVGEEEGAI